MANFFRLSLPAAALNLLVRLRRSTARDTTTIDTSDLNQEVPFEALEGRQRRTWSNRRRHHDPPGESFACTWRQRLIKVAAEIVVSARRILIRLSTSEPFLDEYARICQALR